MITGIDIIVGIEASLRCILMFSDMPTVYNSVANVFLEGN